MSLINKLLVTGALVVGTFVTLKVTKYYVVKQAVESGKTSIDEHYANNLNEQGELPLMWASMSRMSLIGQTMQCTVGGTEIYEELSAYIDTLAAKHKSI